MHLPVAFYCIGLAVALTVASREGGNPLVSKKIVALLEVENARIPVVPCVIGAAVA